MMHRSESMAHWNRVDVSKSVDVIFKNGFPRIDFHVSPSQRLRKHPTSFPHTMSLSRDSRKHRG